VELVAVGNKFAGEVVVYPVVEITRLIPIG
jgi:hypothetical protein